MDLGSLFDDIGIGDVIKGLSTGAQIYSNFRANSAAEDKLAQSNSLAQQELEEKKRQFDLTYALKQQQGAGGGGGGSGAGIAAQMAIQRSNLLSAAYQNQAKLAQEGRSGEAEELNKILQAVQNVLLTKPSGAIVR